MSMANPTTAAGSVHRVTQTLVEHYEQCLAQHGPNAKGMDWGPDERRLQMRFATLCRAMELRRNTNVSVLDVGCGCGLFLEFLRRHYSDDIHYTGLDASPRMIDAARIRFPNAYWNVGDITNTHGVAHCDWVVANGVLTERRHTDQDDMIHFAHDVLRGMFAVCNVGIVFNVLTTHVNYQDPMLFYWAPADILQFACSRLSRHVTLYHDLESYDLFCCVRKMPWMIDHDEPAV